MKNVQWQYLEYKLWGNNKFCWLAASIMPQMKPFKNTSKGLVKLETNWNLFSDWQEVKWPSTVWNNFCFKMQKLWYHQKDNLCPDRLLEKRIGLIMTSPDSLGDTGCQSSLNLGERGWKSLLMVFMNFFYQQRFFLSVFNKDLALGS